MNTVTQEGFQEQYGDMMLNGLCSSNTYIPLRTNKRLGINVAIRPYVIRHSGAVILLGGKLRVGYTLADGGGYEKAAVTAINDEVREEQLREFCKGFSWLRSDSRRSSTLVFFAFAASEYDGELARDTITEEGLATNFLKRLQSTYEQYNDAGFTSIRKAASALNDAWLLQSESSSIFSPMPNTVQLPDEVVGQASALLNQAQDKYHGNVVSFAEKVAELTASVVEEAEDEIENESA